MKNLKCLILISIIFTMFFYKNVNANQNYNYYYFKQDNINNEILNFKQLTFIGDFSIKEYIHILLSNLFFDKDASYIPSKIKILNIFFNDGNLTINFSKNSFNYGGTYYELMFLKQIFLTCFQFKEVESITILIDGELKDLTEGSIVYKQTRFN